MICFLFAAFFLHTAQGHGRLISPVPRFGTGTNNGQENAPVAFGTDQWVCRHDGPVTPVTREITPGGTLDLTWDFGAAHVGDCAVYLSYDVSSTRAEQKFFKVANLPKCKDNNNQVVTITLPEWLPAGQVVVRWDWYALHQHPTVEFYSQCYDAMVTGNNGAQNSLYTYKINNPDLYPSSANVGVGYRNAFNAGEQYMTGPPCALGFDQNNCAMTTCGTTGYIDPKALNGDGTYSCDSFEIDNSPSNTNEEAGEGSEPSASSVCQDEEDQIQSKNKAILGLSLTLVVVLLAFISYVSLKEGWVTLCADDATQPKKVAPVATQGSSVQAPSHAVVPVSGVEWHYQNASGETIGPVSEAEMMKYARTLGKGAESMYVWNGSSVPDWTFLRDVTVLSKQIPLRL
jgi:hypothetical protein